MKHFFLATLIIFSGLFCPAVAIAGGETPSNSSNTINAAHLFDIHCAGCHPQGGNIIRRGKTLKTRALKRYGADNIAAISDLIANGKNTMSAFRDRLTDNEIQALSAYVLQRAEENWRA
ncbi:MAG: c-type cytochrome [Leptolyngbyaceae cyanobacterium MO_188.B28]|nr:c-type cytochrome [Leptolyngbyaceae cyanobacterium MO_188.B28]